MLHFATPFVNTLQKYDDDHQIRENAANRYE